MKLIVLKNNVPLSDVSLDTSDESEMYEIYVGRSEDCHVQIDDPLISRHHLVLKNQEGSWYCEKLSQLGIVIIQGSLVTTSSIQDGDEIKCGAYTFVVSDISHIKKQKIRELQTETVLTHAESDYIPEDNLDILEVSSAPTRPREKPYAHHPTPPDDDSDINTGQLLVAEELEETVVFPEDQQEEAKGYDSLEDNEPLPNLNEVNFSESLQESDSLTEDFISAEVTDNSESDRISHDSLGIATTESMDNQNETTRLFKAFVNYQLVLIGKHAPYDRFQIDVDEVFIGREDKKCQIVLNDPEVSYVHAVLRKSNTEITLEDLNSSNGTILNGERINKAVITTGDEFVIGGTSFSLEVRSDLLDSESERLMPVESNQVVETEEIIEEEVGGDGDISFDGDAPAEKSLIARFRKDPVFRKKAIYVIVGLVLVLMFVDTGEETADKDKKPEAAIDAPKKDAKLGNKKILSKESENARNVSYELGVSYFEQSRFDLAQVEFQKVVSIDSDYKKVQSYLEQTNLGLKRLQEIEAEKRAEEERIKTKKYIEELLVKAREAVQNRQVQLAESFFTQIAEKDPENIEVTQLRIELESWQKEEERKALEKAAKEAARKKMVDALTPGKTSYLKKQWYLAIIKLEEFLRIKNTDEDLIKEASDMLGDAKNQLASEVGPLIGKARSLKEGQDLKAAYQAYLDVQKVEPTNKEALNEIDDIRSSLDARSKKIYREAIIAESLSLFSDAKEKFQEVQQISPTDSDYYKKATEKLRNYLE